LQLYGWQTFKRVGASLTINRIYKIVLTLSITIQLSLFFMIVTVSLWIDQLMNSSIGDQATFTTLYKATSFVTLAVSICPILRRCLLNWSLGLGSLVVPWLGWRPPRIEASYVLLPHHFLDLSHWMGRNVLLDNLPMDLRHMAILFRHGLRFGVPHLCLLHPWGHLPIQLWKGSAQIP
jgi:hypothetical protein